MKLEGDSKLLRLLKQQYSEADSALSPRFGRWKYSLDCWRGQFRDDGFYDDVTTSSFSPLIREADTDLWEDTQELRFFLRELFKHVETFLARLDRAFTSNPRPFALTPPRVIMGQPMSPEELQRRRQVLGGVTQFLCYDYRASNIAAQQVAAMRDALIIDVGYTLSKRAGKEATYPRAELERLPPWDVLPDPLSCDIANARYCIVRHHYSMGEACELWPDSKDEIKARAAKDDTGFGVGASLTEGRKEVTVLHYFGWYDPKALEAALPDDDLQDLGPDKKLVELWMLGTGDDVSEELLDGYPLPFGMDEIPIQDYGILKDPEERGPYRHSLGHILLDGQESMNILFNRSLEAFQYSVLQGGFYDTAFAGGLVPALLHAPKPGEWRGVPLAGADFNKALMPMKYPDVSAAYAQMVSAIGVQDSRLSSVNDQQLGLSTPTSTNTLGEATLLQNESNETFRFRAQQLDGSFRRSYRMHTQVFADALKGWTAEHPQQGLSFLDPETDQYISLDPSVFDEEWEVDLTSGSTLVDGPARAQKLIQMSALMAQAGLPVQMEQVARRVLALQQEDPDLVLGPPGVARAQAMAAQQAQQGLPPGGPMPPGVAPPGMPTQPGLATDAAMAGQVAQ